MPPRIRARFEAPDEPLEALIDHADRAFIRAGMAGRNRADPEQAPAP
ncbi:hypothetical protein [Wenzhouxiangella marina]|uniref:Uncharacterized protein n=1 Tax=Wenzhouxiangella marina TaxID=1579979 RepID=A0A0K0XU94_9GAMM|nr:hypothetical protein [Wenzhouxiangella marina]AKS41253.1 hypothetical protein WM2015_872 [Wenzhouxiangella marina]MBB6088133.1 PleD family two-component response regulator [Wenzhouxiangella marina]